MEKKEMTMESRLLIAFLAMGVVLLVSQYFIKPPPPAPAAEKAAVQSDKSKTAAELPAEKIAAPPPAAEVPGQLQAEKEETITVDTDLYHVVFSNRGAVVRSWILKTYKDHLGQPLELVNQNALAKVAAPFAVVFKGQAPKTQPDTGLFQVERSADGLTLNFEFSDGRADTKKSFKFSPKSYLVEITSEVVENGVRIPHSLAWRGGFGDPTAANQSADQHTLFYDLANAKLTQKQVKEAKDGPVSVSGQYSFAGLEDHYFAGVFLPVAHGPVELTTFSDGIPDRGGTEEARIGAGVGGDGLNRFTFFAGPKDADILRTVDPKLEQLIDWGTWFGIIAKPLFVALNWTADHVTHNYGWAIIVVTIAINTVLFPLRLTSMKSSKKMQLLKPQIDAINEKYKSLSLKDPRKAEQNQELMDLYKKNGVNPVGGCLPMVLQLPFLIAFYTVLSVAIELRGASWFWVKDLSQAESLPIHILPVLLVITQFLSQKMTPSPGMDPAQQKMMMFMPLVFGYMFYFASAGLVLYWLTGNLVGVAQQWLLNRSTPAPAAAVITPPPKKKRN
jgi:YidC/Oxa1 family membrane protein insertase